MASSLLPGQAQGISVLSSDTGPCHHVLPKPSIRTHGWTGRPPLAKAQKGPFPAAHSRAGRSIACSASLTGVSPDQAMEAVERQLQHQESLRLGQSHFPSDNQSKLDEEWLRLGLSFPTQSADATVVASLETAASPYNPAYLDDIWLHRGLSFTELEPSLVAQEPEGVEDEEEELESLAQAVEVEEDVRTRVQTVEAPPVAVDSSQYFATDLRPIVLFDGTCNFCSRWTVFLLDADPLGNLRFASMQSEAGKAFLRRAGLKEMDTSEIVLASHKRSYIGSQAILQIFARCEMPFPLIAAAGSVMPGVVNDFVYKMVSKYRHKFGGPPACRLFDPRFNERFVS